MRRGWCLLGVAGLVIWVAGCGTRAAGEGRGRPSPVQGHVSADAPAAGRRAAPAGTPLSGSFLMDLTWVSDQRGWALSAGSCGRGLCPRLATTRNGGRTWTALPAPPGHVQDQQGLADCGRAACVSQVRFATATVGYLFGPALYQTSDGGRSWHRVPSRPVEALEPSAGTVARIVYDHTGCPGPCDRTVQQTTAGSATWHTVLRIPAASAAYSVAAQLIRQGMAVSYIPLYGHVAGGASRAYTVIFRSTDGGATWQRSDDPCAGIATEEYDSSGLAAAPGGFAAVLCAPRAGAGPAFVRTSADDGSSWGPARPVPGAAGHYLDLIAAPGAGQLVLATGGDTGGGSFNYRLAASADGGLHWSAAVTGTARIDPQAPAAEFLGFEDARTGRWLSDSHDIWTTHDGGQRWRVQPFR